MPVAPVFVRPFDLFESFEAFRPSREIIWDHWTRNFTHRVPKSQPKRDLNVEVALSRQEAMHGGRLGLQIPVGKLCSRCDGSGSTGYFTCDLCQGHGMFWETAQVDVLLSPPVPDGMVIPVSLKHLGIENLNLRLHVSVAA